MAISKKKVPKKTVEILENRPNRLDRIYQITGVIILILLAIALCFFLYHRMHRPSKNTDSPELTKLPKDFKEQLSQTASAEAKLRIPVLMYHYIEYVQDKGDKLRQSLDVNPDIFNKQLETLQDAGYTFLFMSDVADIMDGKAPMPEKPIVLTFDDGYRDFYTGALPIIKKHNVKTTAYIVPGFINGTNSMFNYQVIEATQSGLVEIGAHTVHHLYLKGQPLKNATKEIQNSKTMLENMYHVPVTTFAYPYGAFDQQAVDIVKQTGFRTAVSTIPGIEVSNTNKFLIFRLRPGVKIGQQLLELLEQTTFKPY
jgi:peptidoglycan/xylan/chitin deacetylase (PgdA/CDA1 family)